MTSEKFLKWQAAGRGLHAKAEWYKRYQMTWLLGDEYAPAQAFTQDEHDPSISGKPFPNKGYIRQMVELWLGTKMEIWGKSPRRLSSWWFWAMAPAGTKLRLGKGGRPLHFSECSKE